MGADWLWKTENNFRRSIQELAVKGLQPAPLFGVDEKVSVTYACHWLNEQRTLPLKTRLTIYQYAEKAKVAVLFGNEAVAEVRGGAVNDLMRLFSDHPELCRMLPVEILLLGKPTEPFYVRAITDTKKGK